MAVIRSKTLVASHLITWSLCLGVSFESYLEVIGWRCAFFVADFSRMLYLFKGSGFQNSFTDLSLSC